ncbi:MAG TPA: NADH-ubiquinone oxidoreductase-F iron-sulfur binding region domain-containing protein [Syntrophales bacterium]|nr:NADH-ubiquinone oxidoreductase-F iron-sulfur binding region domain-containing protein [Syntrophales bacterium]
MSKINTLEALNKAAKKGQDALFPAKKIRIAVGMATNSIAAGARSVYEALAEELKNRNLKFELTQTGSMGFDSMEPLVDFVVPNKPRLSFGKATVEKVPVLLDQVVNLNLDTEQPFYRVDEQENILSGEKTKYIKGRIPKAFSGIPLMEDIPFYKKQVKIVTRNCGIINPGSMEEYIARGGYFALYKALTEMSPDQVIDEVIASGLRGRGGGGFPTGLKWRSCRDAKGSVKYVICNGDEGDPGAYMDRSVMEGDPHSVIEGMIIGAYAIGAKQGYIYVRNEYPLAVANLTKAIEQAKKAGLLGKNIFNSGFAFDIKINKGAGAFVCGESTALVASLEGKAGEPKAKYTHMVEHGLWDRPTNINNVETWNNVPVVIARGGGWFAQIGTKTSSGTKVFSLVGKVNNIGLVEVPMGTTIKEIVYDVGGGIAQGKTFKAVQTGGPSGGCIPGSLIDLPVGFDELGKAGSMMGSGGMIVMDNTTCMVDIAKYFVNFLAKESCGKCTPCREGIRRMRDILEDICAGKGQEGDIDLLKDMSDAMIDGSLCALGGSAPNPVLSTLRYFQEEYEAHIRDKKCAAGVCKALIKFRVVEDKCNGCGKCRKVCPTRAAKGLRKEVHEIDQALCIQCRACYEVCAFNAIIIE